MCLYHIFNSIADDHSANPNIYLTLFVIASSFHSRVVLVALLIPGLINAELFILNAYCLP